jgi:hypothetical protein
MNDNFWSVLSAGCSVIILLSVHKKFLPGFSRLRIPTWQGEISQGNDFLFSQVSQVFFDRLQFEFQFTQVTFQEGDLFCLGLVAAREVTVIPTAFTATVTGLIIFAPTGTIVAIAFFFV